MTKPNCLRDEDRLLTPALFLQADTKHRGDPKLVPASKNGRVS